MRGIFIRWQRIAKMLALYWATNTATKSAGQCIPPIRSSIDPRDIYLA